MEERERLRDRLVALGEMAAAIAHQVKNPLAGIEVMAGVLKRQVGHSPDAQSILNDIINEAKMANRIVHEALEFVRPIRLQVEHTSIADVINDSVSLAESKVPRRNIHLRLDLEDGLPPIQGDHHQLCQLFTNLLINAFEALEGTGTVTLSAREGVLDEEPHGPAGFWTRLPRLRAPSLFVWGRHDTLVPVGFARHVREVLADAEHLELQCGHVPQLECPRATHEAVQRFLNPG